MGFGDKLKGLRDQAQQAVAENKDKIQGAVQVVGDVANTKTHGRYATKIAKVGEKVEQSVEKVAHGEGGPVDSDDASAAPIVSEPPAPMASEPPAPIASEPPAPIASEPPAPVSASKADEAATGFPEFE